MAIFNDMEIKEVEEIEYIDNDELKGRVINWSLVKEWVHLGEHPNMYSMKDLPIDKFNFNVLFSRRGTGKTTTLLLCAIVLRMLYSSTSEYVRQKDEMIKASTLMTIFDTIIQFKLIPIVTSGKWNGIYYHWKYFYLANYDKDGKMIEKDIRPFLHCASLNEWSNLKSTYNNPSIILFIFDEFEAKITNNEEWLWLHQIISTYRRRKLNVRIVMLGNTISPHNYYFREMEVSQIVAKMQPRDYIGVTSKKGTKIYLEYVEPIGNAEKSEKRKLEDYTYHGFDGLNSITGDGWEFDYYPHITRELYKHKDTQKLDRFYIDSNGLLLKCDMVYTSLIGYCVFVQPTNYIPNDGLTFIQGRDIQTPYEVKGMGFTQQHRKLWLLFHAGKWLFATNNEGSIVEQFIISEKTRLC